MDDVFSQHLLSPMLIADEKPAFNDANYIYELKLDGTRCLAYLDQTVQQTKITDYESISRIVTAPYNGETSLCFRWRTLCLSS